jgi:hypothetical protein
MEQSQSQSETRLAARIETQVEAEAAGRRRDGGGSTRIHMRWQLDADPHVAAVACGWLKERMTPAGGLQLMEGHMWAESHRWRRQSHG